MNKADSERIASVLENMRYIRARAQELADLMIINACSVRQSAIDRVYAKARVLANSKSKRQVTLVVTGCILEKDRREFSKNFDLLFNIKDLEKLPNFLQKLNPEIKIVPDTPLAKQVEKESGKLSFEEESYLRIAPKRENPFTALVPISNGCNKFCTYCAVPYTRGLEICRPASEIIDEIKKYVSEKKVKEIVLLGQTVNSYFDKNGVNFAQLLRKVCQLPGKFWIRFTSPYPTHFTPDIIGAMAEEEKIQKYINLPLQSGDNNVLKRMNRRYTVEEYRGIVQKLRKKIPEISLSTDIIVGFCGETEKEFQNTVKLVKEIKFDMAYIARYSPRPGTLASKNFEDNISPQEKIKRHKILTEIVKTTALENSQKYLGKLVEVLITERKRNYLYGNTNTMKTVIIPFSGSLKKLVGSFAKVRTTETSPFVLMGRIAGKLILL